MVDNAFNIIQLILGQVNSISADVEHIIVNLCCQILQVSFDIAPIIFTTINMIIDKNIMSAGQPEEMFSECLDNFSQYLGQQEFTDKML